MHSAVAEILTGKSFFFFFARTVGGNSLKSSMGKGEEGCLATHFKVIIF